tara:strand:- start:571 stop:717 length:147 start_codon:yes stop_codon:yes gene_type:complete
MNINKDQTSALLKQMLGNDTEFRPGQYEIIDSVINSWLAKTLFLQGTI